MDNKDLMHNVDARTKLAGQNRRWTGLVKRWPLTSEFLLLSDRIQDVVS